MAGQFEIENNVLIKYYEQEGITDVVISEGVTKIGTAAFDRCRRLTSINIPNSVTEIGNAAFFECTSLISINIPQNVKEIGFMAFASCRSLTEITIPDSVTLIDFFAFDGCDNIKTFNIPSYNIFNMLDDESKAIALNTIIRDKKQEQYSKEDINNFKKYIIEHKINKDEEEYYKFYKEDKNDIFKFILKNNLMDLLNHMLKNNIYTKDELMDLIKDLTEKYKDKTEITGILLEYSNKNREEKDIKTIIDDRFNLDGDIQVKR